MPDASELLAHQVTTTRFGDSPASAIQHAKIFILDSFGVGIARRVIRLGFGRGGADAGDPPSRPGHNDFQTSGTMQPHVEGSVVLPMQVGVNARAALESCDLAAAGIPGPRDTFEGPFGFLTPATRLFSFAAFNHLIGFDDVRAFERKWTRQRS